MKYDNLKKAFLKDAKESFINLINDTFDKLEKTNILEKVEKKIKDSCDNLSNKLNRTESFKTWNLNSEKDTFVMKLYNKMEKEIHEKHLYWRNYQNIDCETEILTVNFKNRITLSKIVSIELTDEILGIHTTKYQYALTIDDMDYTDFILETNDDFFRMIEKELEKESNNTEKYCEKTDKMRLNKLKKILR